MKSVMKLAHLSVDPRADPVEFYLVGSDFSLRRFCPTGCGELKYLSHFDSTISRYIVEYIKCDGLCNSALWVYFHPCNFLNVMPGSEGIDHSIMYDRDVVADPRRSRR